jgi:hypothetical protein
VHEWVGRWVGGRSKIRQNEKEEEDEENITFSLVKYCMHANMRMYSTGESAEMEYYYSPRCGRRSG